jgi:very-short-patch-repair endonuclease
MCPDDTNEVRELIDQIGNVTLIVIDTLHRNFGAGDENSSKDFAQFLNNIDRQLKPCGATILVIHHSGHGDKERGRGSSAIRAAMDFEYKVEKKQADKKLCFSNTKMKDFKPPEAMFFDFRTEGDSVVLELDDSYKTKGGTKRDKPLNGNSLKVFQVLNKALKIAGEKPPQLIIDYFEHDRSQLPDKVVTVEVWREFAYPAMTVMGEDEKKKTNALKIAYQRARKEIADKGHTGNHGDYYWLAYPPKADEMEFTELLEGLNNE